MPSYTPQQIRDLIFRFTPGSYTPQSFAEVPFRFGYRPVYSETSNMTAALNVMGLYQTTTYTYLRYCPTYVIGYTRYGVQIIKGRCVYGGIRDIGAYISAQPPHLDLPAYIFGEVGFVSGYKNLPALISGLYKRDLGSIIGVHEAGNIGGYLNVLSTTYDDITGSLHGFDTYDLNGILRGLQHRSLPSYLNPIVGVDLNAYLNVWPQRDLPGNIYGWSTSDLSAYLNTMQKYDLPVTIGVHPPVDLPVYPLRVWAREVTSDLSAYLMGLVADDLPAYLRCKYFSDLNSYLFVIDPVYLTASIHGWDIKNLPASLVGTRYPYDLSASLTPIPEAIKDLGGFLRAMYTRDLTANVHAWWVNNLSALIVSQTAPDLHAYINPTGYSRDLPSSIYPKRIRLTTVLSVSTMENLNLSAMINAACGSSMGLDLPAYIRCVYKSDLSALIRGYIQNWQQANLSASIGYSDNYSVIDKLPLSISLRAGKYRVEDKLPIYFSLFRGGSSLGAYITGILTSQDLSAEITATYLDNYHFDRSIDRFRVYFLNRMGISETFETVELVFKSVVADYFYSSSGNVAWKTNRLDRWALELSSYIPRTEALNIRRKLHKAGTLYDLTRFNSVDEAMKHVIDYITTYPQSDLSALIQASGRFNNLQGILNVKEFITDYNSLPSQITCVKDQLVVGSDTGINIF